MIALSVISCAAQFALGRDLMPAARDQTRIVQPPSSPAYPAAVNRGAKADRAASPAILAAQTRTVSLRLDGFSATTFLLRVPMADSNPLSASPSPKSGMRRPMVACDPVVSVLTDVFKRLQPGRCVT